MKTYADRHDDDRRKKKRPNRMMRQRFEDLDEEDIQEMIDSPHEDLMLMMEQFNAPPEREADESHLIGDDHTAEAEGKIGKSAFLEMLEAEVRANLAESFEGTGFSEKDCPWLKHLFRHYKHRGAAHLEKSIHKYLPETRNAESVEEYVAPLQAKVQRAIAAWLKNGEITEVPDEIPRSLLQMAGQGAANQRAKMGKGKELESGTKSKMEGAFSANIGDVKVHTDSDGSAFAKELDAQAATIGKDIAFASDKYKPGTPEGDALIAHELAHVMQQSGAIENGEVGSGADYSAMEKDAEGATMGVMGKLFGKAKGMFGDLRINGMTRLKSGLQVQRCGSGTDPQSKEPQSTDFMNVTPVNDSRSFYIRGESRFNKIKQTLQQADVLVDGTPDVSNDIKKQYKGKLTDFYLATVSTVESTPSGVKTLLDSFVAPGGEMYITTDDFAAKLKEILAAYRKDHPNTFSDVIISNVVNQQGIHVSGYGNDDDPSCIETMNKCIENAYGSETLQKSSLNDAAFKSIKTLQKKGMADSSQKVKIDYIGDPTRFKVDPDQLFSQSLKFNGKTFSETLTDLVKDEENGNYIFVCSIINGYHSILMIVNKTDNGVSFIWKDDNPAQDPSLLYTVYTANKLDDQLFDYAVGRSNRRITDRFNKTYNTTFQSYKEIVNDSRTPKIELLEKPNLLDDAKGDWENTLVARLNPTKP